MTQEVAVSAALAIQSILKKHHQRWVLIQVSGHNLLGEASRGTFLAAYKTRARAYAALARFTTDGKEILCEYAGPKVGAGIAIL